MRIAKYAISVRRADWLQLSLAAIQEFSQIGWPSTLASLEQVLYW